MRIFASKPSLATASGSVDADPGALASSTIERCERELEPLTERVDSLTARLASIDAELAQTTAERAAALLDGTSTLSLGATIRELTDERAALSDVIGTVSSQILDKRSEQAAARAELQQLEVQQRAAEARARAEQAKAKVATALRDFVGSTFPVLMRELRESDAAAREACAGSGETWYGQLFANPMQANLAIYLEHAGATAAQQLPVQADAAGMLSLTGGASAQTVHGASAA